ncbi:MAG: DUF6691 family protein [Thiohalomonadaceae bacterium]
MPAIHLVFGTGFGFLLSRAGATEFDFYARLFLFQDLQLLWVISSAVAVGVAGILLLKRTGAQSVVGRQALTFEGRPYRRGLVLGALLFGAGWGLAGACPGSVLAMLGQGKLAALPTMVGIVLGTWLYALLPTLRRI